MCSTVAASSSSTDASGRITHVNELFCRISGYSREELIGRNHNVINSGHHPRKFFMDMYRNIATGHPWRGEICNRAKDGEHFWLDITIIPSTDNSGRVVRYTSVCVDITARKKTEEMLARLRERHALAIDGSGVCLWDWDLVRDCVEFDGNWARCSAIRREEAAQTPRDALESRHASGRSRQPRCIRSNEHCRGRDAVLRKRARACVTEDGHWVSLLFRGSVNKRDQNGLALRISGTAIEISQLKQAVRQAEQSEALLKTVIDLLPQRVFWKDSEGRFLGANRNFKSDVGVENIVGKTDQEVPWAGRATRRHAGPAHHGTSSAGAEPRAAARLRRSDRSGVPPARCRSSTRVAKCGACWARIRTSPPSRPSKPS